MKKYVDENIVMQFYIEQLDADNIGFLVGKPEKKKKIRDIVARLLETERLNDRIGIATELWKQLFEASMMSIDHEKQGYDRLFEYFDDYVEFEELIFASDSFYRDHTLHCIWVYFLGVYLTKQSEFAILTETYKNSLQYYDRIIELYEKIGLINFAEVKKVVNGCEAYKEVVKSQDALFCVEALTHDLGYPLKKIEKINKSIRKILPYYAVNTFGEFKFEYSNVNQHFIEEFLKVVTYDISFSNKFETLESYRLIEELITGNENGGIESINEERCRNITEEEKEILKNGLRITAQGISSYGAKVNMAKDFEAYQHGIMSAYILARNLFAFQNMKIDIEKDISVSSKELADYMKKSFILQSVSLHTSDAFRIKMIDESSFLTFIDELEEFSRISRASQSREYVEEFCKSEIGMEDGWFSIDFIFDNNDLANLDPERAFRGRCKRFLSLFDIGNLDENLKIRLRCIGKLEKNQKVYTLEIANHHAKIFVDDVEQDIPTFVKSSQFYTSEEYANF